MIRNKIAVFKKRIRRKLDRIFDRTLNGKIAISIVSSLAFAILATLISIVISKKANIDLCNKIFSSIYYSWTFSYVTHVFMVLYSHKINITKIVRKKLNKAKILEQDWTLGYAFIGMICNLSIVACDIANVTNAISGDFTKYEVTKYFVFVVSFAVFISNIFCMLKLDKQLINEEQEILITRS